MDSREDIKHIPGLGNLAALFCLWFTLHACSWTLTIRCMLLSTAVCHLSPLFWSSTLCFPRPPSGLNNEEYQAVIGNDTTSYIIEDLEPARNYTFYIVAYMPMGASRMSDQVSQHTLEDGEHRDGRHSWQ